MNTTWGLSPRDTLLGTLARRVEDSAEAPFLKFRNEVVTYVTFANAVRKMAAGLEEAGVSGGYVLSMMDNSSEAAVLWYATNAAGATYVPLNTGLKGQWLEKQYERIAARVVVAGSDYVELLRRLVDSDKSAPRFYVHDPVFARTEDALKSLSTQGELDELPDVSPTDVAAITFTSGTTAASKACMLTHGYISNQAGQIVDFTERRAEETLWTCLPLFHLNAMGSLASTALVGGVAAVSRRFSLRSFWDDVEETGANIIQMLGSIPWLVANGPESEAAKRCFGQVRAAVGAPISPEVASRLKSRFGIRQIASNVYGMTEALCLTYARCSDENPLGSSGRRNEDFDVRIFNGSEEEVAPGIVGEIVFRPLRPNVMFSGYLHAPEEAVVRSANLWWHTGDQGSFDTDGNLFFADRDKDMVRRRGEMIATVEVEDILSSHPDVLEASIHGVESEFGDDDIKATVLLREGHVLSATDFLSFAVERLPLFAVPRYVEFRLELPRNELGRVLKRQLREEGVPAGTWDATIGSDVFLGD